MLALPKEKTALIVVDVQNSFCTPQGLLGTIGFDLSACIAAVEPCRRLVDAAHAADVPVIFTRYVFRKDYRDQGMLGKLVPDMERVGCLIEGTDDAQIVDALPVLPQDFIVDKNRPSSFYATTLETYLRSLQIQSLVVCGVTTNCCVETTVRDASQRDYETFIVEDAVGETDPERHRIALKSMGLLFGQLVRVADVEQAWR
jgi:ureidoacrylate peracid hydrolase